MINNKKIGYIYPFEKKYFDLSTFKITTIEPDQQHNFKTNSKYQFRFYSPDLWSNNFYRTCKHKNSIFEITYDNTINLTNQLSSEIFIITNTDDNKPLDNIVGKHFLFATNSGVVEIKRLNAPDGLIIRKYNEQGDRLFQSSIEHTKVKIEGKTHYYQPYLQYFSCTDESLVFTSNNLQIPSTQLIDIKTGINSTFNYSINGIIRSDNENSIQGFVMINQEKQTFEINFLKNKWKQRLECYANKAETVKIGSTLIIAFYHEISTGSALFAYNLETGKIIWTADVEQLNISHSEYYNKVHLSIYQEYIIMEGIEAEGKYLQIFDFNTGKRLFSSI